MIPPAPIKANVAYALRPILINVGRTPAFKVDYNFAVETMQGKLPPTLKYFKRDQHMSAFMLPGQVIRMEEVMIGAFSENQIRQLLGVFLQFQITADKLQMVHHSVNRLLHSSHHVKPLINL